MRHISFALTKDQIRARTKTVTRRIGWTFLSPGTILRAVEKAQGLKKGEVVVPLATIVVDEVRREPLNRLGEPPSYGRREVALEGFPAMEPFQFVDWFARTHGCEYDDLVTRIAFHYVDDVATVAT